MLLAHIRNRQDQQTNLSQSGFTREQIDHFLHYRAMYRTGHYQRDAEQERRLAFARWLYRHGKLSEA